MLVYAKCVADTAAFTKCAAAAFATSRSSTSQLYATNSAHYYIANACCTAQGTTVWLTPRAYKPTRTVTVADTMTTTFTNAMKHAMMCYIVWLTSHCQPLRAAS
jgi:hypothetical protein